MVRGFYGQCNVLFLDFVQHGANSGYPGSGHSVDRRRGIYLHLGLFLSLSCASSGLFQYTTAFLLGLELLSFLGQAAVVYIYCVRLSYLTNMALGDRSTTINGILVSCSCSLMSSCFSSFPGSLHDLPSHLLARRVHLVASRGRLYIQTGD